MHPIIITTYDWVPPMAQGYVRDLRVRWILEELGRPYKVEVTPVHPKAASHGQHQPFEQVPFIRDGDLHLFETGAILLHLAQGTALLPPGHDGAHVTQWLIAALNSVEPFVMGWAQAKFFDKDDAAADRASGMMMQRLTQLQAALEDKSWLMGDRFSCADILMADILRIPGDNDLLTALPGLAAYLDRAKARPGFRAAYDGQMAHWRQAEAKRRLP